MNPVINKTSEKTLKSIVNNMPQSMLLTGPDGVGLGTIAKYISELLDTKPIIILPEKDEKIDLLLGVIGIDIMRKLYDDSRTKTANIKLILIDYAERMTIQAQNAFLKLLEEPGSNTYFVLISHSASKLLPTILSRTVRLEIKPISLAQSNDLLDTLGVSDSTKRSQILYIADGLPAELTRLATDDEYFEKRSLSVRDARELLRASLYQKLITANRYKDDRAATLRLLTDAMSILKISITDKPDISTIKHIDLLLNAYQQIEANGNIRLCMARMLT